MEEKFKDDGSFLHSIIRTAGKAINRYNLIEAGDNVVAAISGGKDSIAMLDILARRRKHLPVNYEITAVHIHLENIGYEIDRDFYDSFCESLNVKFIFLRSSFNDRSSGSKSACYLCALHRRKILFEFMKKDKFGKLALGHHMDDAVETLYMNMLFNGQISSMPPKVSMFKGDFEIIRPLILLRDKEIQRYADIKKFPEQKIPCPHSKFSKRNDIRQIIEQMEQLYPNGVRNIFRSMGDIKPDYLPKINLD